MDERGMLTRQDLIERREELDQRQLRLMVCVMTGSLLLALAMYMLLESSHKPLAIPLCVMILLIGPAASLLLGMRQSSQLGLRCPTCGGSFGRKDLLVAIETGECPQCDARILDDTDTGTKGPAVVCRPFSRALLKSLGFWGLVTIFYWAANHSSGVLSPENSRLLRHVGEGAIVIVLLTCLVNLLYLPAKMVGLALHLVKDCTFKELVQSFLLILLLFLLFGSSLAFIGDKAQSAQQNEKSNPVASSNRVESLN